MGCCCHHGYHVVADNILIKLFPEKEKGKLVSAQEIPKEVLNELYAGLEESKFQLYFLSKLGPYRSSYKVLGQYAFDTLKDIFFL